MPPHRLYHPHGHELRNHGGRTVADERKRDACDGHDAHAHAYLLEHLKRPHGSAAHADELAEHRLAAHAKNYRRENHPREEPKQHNPADKAELLSEKGKDEVGLGLRKKAVARLRGTTDALAEKPAGPHGDFCL